MRSAGDLNELKTSITCFSFWRKKLHLIHQRHSKTICTMMFSEEHNTWNIFHDFFQEQLSYRNYKDYVLLYYSIVLQHFLNLLRTSQVRWIKKKSTHRFSWSVCLGNHVIHHHVFITLLKTVLENFLKLRKQGRKEQGFFSIYSYTCNSKLGNTVGGTTAVSCPERPQTHPG